MPFRLEHAVGHCPGRLFLATNEFTKKSQVCSSVFAFIACTAPITPYQQSLQQPLPTPAAVVCCPICSVLYISYYQMIESFKPTLFGPGYSLSASFHYTHGKQNHVFLQDSDKSTRTRLVHAKGDVQWSMSPWHCWRAPALLNAPFGPKGCR